MSLATVINASAHSLPMLADASVQAVITSPPYYGLRQYAGEQGVEWPAVEYAPMAGLPPLSIPAMQGALGHEPTLEAYIGHLVLCLREWRRVLRADGVALVNLGDSYSSDGKWGGATGGKHAAGLHGQTGVGRERRATGLGNKQMLMVPARFALAAQADGWYLRSDIIWHKPNAMPESVTDRPTKAHEYVYLLAKSERYFWDSDAVREPHSREWWVETINTDGTKVVGDRRDGGNRQGNGNPAGRNMRSVLSVATKAHAQAHFAVWPEALVEPMVRASTSERGACSSCGAPWQRVVEREPMEIRRTERGEQMGEYGRTQASGTMLKPASVHTIGWQPGCNCEAGEPAPCVVLDPFAGSGTTLRVAVRLGRRAIGVDISREYLEELVPDRLTAQMELAI